MPGIPPEIRWNNQKNALQLWNKEGWVVRREGDPLEVAQWLQACHDAGIEVRVQVNESVTP
ncbi:hypothetical protein [Shigella sonnei]|uniref:hypothetical protein n=1 Tax=Shigella sonnei TaxID=624 RepID=UPI000699327D|nr:hypothetical protein [Shigella sonnei]